MLGITRDGKPFQLYQTPGGKNFEEMRQWYFANRGRGRSELGSIDFPPTMTGYESFTRLALYRLLNRQPRLSQADFHTEMINELSNLMGEVVSGTRMMEWRATAELPWHGNSSMASYGRVTMAW